MEIPLFSGFLERFQEPFGRRVTDGLVGLVGLAIAAVCIKLIAISVVIPIFLIIQKFGATGTLQFLSENILPSVGSFIFGVLASMLIVEIILQLIYKPRLKRMMAGYDEAKESFQRAKDDVTAEFELIKARSSDIIQQTRDRIEEAKVSRDKKGM